MPKVALYYLACRDNVVVIGRLARWATLVHGHLSEDRSFDLYVDVHG